MKFKKKLLSLATAIALGGVAATAQAGTGTDTWITFDDNTTPSTAPLPYVLTTGVYTITGAYIPTGPVYTAAFVPFTNDNGTPLDFTDDFTVNTEFRMISPGGTVGGGGEKSIVGPSDFTGAPPAGPLEWHIDPSGVITTVNSDITPTTGADGLWLGANFFGAPFGFINAGPTSMVKDFGAGTISFTWADGFVAEWGGTFFPLGDCDAANQVFTDGQGCGITLSGTLTGTPDNFDFWIWGEHRLTSWEATAGDTTAPTGFAGWNAQWELHGSGTQAVPVPAAVWLFGSGLLGLVGVARRKKKSA